MTRDRPPLWSILGTLVGAPLFMGFVIVYVPYGYSGWRLAPPLLGSEATRWAGAGLVVLALPLFLDFLLRFVREGHGTPMPFAPPGRLVVRGVYRFVRNPGYIAALATIAGQGLIFGSVPVLVYALVMAVVFHLFVVLWEEPDLRRRFGAAYESYCREVPRWLPRRGRPRDGAAPG